MTISIMRDMRIVSSSILICIQKSFVIFIYKGYINRGNNGNDADNKEVHAVTNGKHLAFKDQKFSCQK